MNDRPHLDEEALAELRDVMEDEFAILIQTYISDSRERIRSLRHALTAEDSDRFARTAHSFKGSSVNIGAARLGAICQQAERAGRDARLHQAAQLVDALESEFETVRGLMEKGLTDFRA